MKRAGDYGAKERGCETHGTEWGPISQSKIDREDCQSASSQRAALVIGCGVGSGVLIPLPSSFSPMNLLFLIFVFLFFFLLRFFISSLHLPDYCRCRYGYGLAYLQRGEVLTGTQCQNDALGMPLSLKV